jgi:hypothetical protein
MNAPVEPIGPIKPGNPAEFNARELAENVMKATGSKSFIAFRPSRLTIQCGTGRIFFCLRQMWWSPHAPMDEDPVRAMIILDLPGQS